MRMRKLTLPLAFLVAFSFAAACSDDDGGGGGLAGEASGGSEGNSGGTGTGAHVGTGGGDMGVAGGAGGEACVGETETLVEGVEAFAIALSVSDDGAAYVTRATVSAPTDLSVVGLDGTGDGVIYSSPDGSRISSLAWSGSDLLFLEDTESATAETLYTVPAAGGDATAVTATTFQNGRLLGADADAAYIHVNSAPYRIVRVMLASGDVETVGTVPAPGSVIHHVISDGEIFFLGGSGISTVYRLATDAADAEPEAVFAGADNAACGFPLGGLTATPTKLVCGFTGVGAVSRDDGVSDGPVIAADPLHPASHMVVASSGESVYMVERTAVDTDGELRRAESDGSNETVLVCDLRNLPMQTVDGFFPLANHYQIGIGGGRIVWIEEAQPDVDDAIVSIRSAPL